MKDKSSVEWIKSEWIYAMIHSDDEFDKWEKRVNKLEGLMLKCKKCRGTEVPCWQHRTVLKWRGLTRGYVRGMKHMFNLLMSAKQATDKEEARK